MTPAVFHRTPSGLSNMHRFSASGSDAIVFVEGGRSHTLHEVFAGRFENESLHIAFWQRCFTELGPRMDLEFRAIGSKPTLRSIARLIAEGVVTHVYVAMDRDFDNHLGAIVSSPKVLYTFGYSWENDVWNEAVTADVFYTLCGIDRSTTTSEVQTILAKGFADFERDVRWVVKADFLCIKHAIACLPRQAPNKVIKQTTGTSAPAMDRAALRRCVRSARTQKASKLTAGMKMTLRPRVDCCGHIVGALGYSLIKYLFRKFCKSANHPRGIIDAIVIDKFFDRIRNGHFSSLRRYYEQQIAA